MAQANLPPQIRKKMSLSMILKHVFTVALMLGVACGSPSSDNGSSRDAGAEPAPDTGPPPCEWPTENMGVATGQHVPSNLAWQGFGPGETEERSISIEEFYDCHGGEGIHGVLVITSQYGCSRCTAEASELTAKIAEWADEGLNIRVLTLKLEDSNGTKPASMEGVNHWRDQYGLTTSFVAYDNGYSMVPREGSGGVSFGTPINSVIDPRTMEVIDVIQTFDRTYASLLELARMRAAE
jgi:hypothetical protein